MWNRCYTRRGGNSRFTLYQCKKDPGIDGQTDTWMEDGTEPAIESEDCDLKSKLKFSYLNKTKSEILALLSAYKVTSAITRQASGGLEGNRTIDGKSSVL